MGASEVVYACDIMQFVEEGIWPSTEPHLYTPQACRLVVVKVRPQAKAALLLRYCLLSQLLTGLATHTLVLS